MRHKKILEHVEKHNGNLDVVSRGICFRDLRDDIKETETIIASLNKTTPESEYINLFMLDKIRLQNAIELIEDKETK